MTKSPFDYVTSINKQEKVEVGRNYDKFLTTRQFSYFIDTILIAAESSKHLNMDNELHYEFLFNGIRKRNRFSKWFKPEENEVIKMIMDYYEIGFNKASEILRILKQDELDYIKEFNKKGE